MLTPAAKAPGAGDILSRPSAPIKKRRVQQGQPGEFKKIFKEKLRKEEK